MGAKCKQSTQSIASEILSLPQPGQTVTADEDLRTEDFEITPKTTIRVLKDKLQQYGCPVSGNKDALIERLRSFASEKESWRGIILQPRARHQRGAQMGTAANKHSAKRVAEIRGVDRTQRKLQEADIVNNDAWADRVLAMCANAAVPPLSLASRAGSPPVSPDVTAVSAVTPSRHDISIEQMSCQKLAGSDDNYQLVRAISQMNHKLDALGMSFRTHLAQPSISSAASFLHAPTVRPPADILQAHGQSDTMETTSAPPSHSHEVTVITAITAPPPPTSLHIRVQARLTTVPQDQIDPENLAVVQLHDGSFAFDRTSVPVIRPGILFSNDLPRLFREWHSADDPKTSALTINGRGIPVKDWPLIFKKRLGNRVQTWSDMKTIWGNWKFVAEERDRFESDEAFWAAWTDNKGDRMCYQHILDGLKQNRMKKDAKDAADTRRYFNGDLGSPAARGVFQYQKGNGRGPRRYVLTKDAHVAEKWRGLLAMDAWVAAQWREMEASG
ncbi:hypothetical protein A0H81_06466 [Grifola frondosa]|uniref:SAP domain-containing protein n=1 Tax=Grifola frondosa TaxID=5627 RepID=A0A1C7MBD1_GRIFR|nr:hypothetical protein A0H81_06466 [Grifola frondosa]